MLVRTSNGSIIEVRQDLWDALVQAFPIRSSSFVTKVTDQRVRKCEIKLAPLDAPATSVKRGLAISLVPSKIRVSPGLDGIHRHLRGVEAIRDGLEEGPSLCCVWRLRDASRPIEQYIMAGNCCFRLARATTDSHDATREDGESKQHRKRVSVTTHDDPQVSRPATAGT